MKSIYQLVVHFNDFETDTTQSLFDARDAEGLLNYMEQWDSGDGGEEYDAESLSRSGNYSAEEKPGYLLIYSWAFGDATLYAVRQTD